MWCDIIILLTIFAMPYNIIGEELGTVIMTVVGIIYLFKKSKNSLKINKVYLIVIMTLLFSGIVSFLFSINYINSLNGIMIYVNVIIFYFVFMLQKNEKRQLFKYATYIISIFAVIFIIYQGVILKQRIYGNIGYANTYALILLCNLYFNEFYEDNKIYIPIQVVSILGILYTGSRNTLIWVLIFVGLKVFKHVKEKDRLTTLLSSIMAIIIYFSVEAFGIGAFLILPVVLYAFYSLLKNSKVKIYNAALIIFVIISIPAFVFINTNTTKRIQNTSLESGVFQERLIYFEDSVKHILKYPLGSGINNFEYKEYENQSVFYDVKYIHNSFLQIAYDSGIIAFTAFIGLFICGIYFINKQTSENKAYYLFLYITIYLHSLLDFDFSFSSIFVIVSMLLAFSTAKEEHSLYLNWKIRIISLCPIFLIAAYLIIINSVYLIGDKYMANNNYLAARNAYNLNNAIIYRDSNVNYKIANTYKAQYDFTGDKGALEACLHELLCAEKINKVNPKIVWNEVYMYEKLGNNNKTIEYENKLLNMEKYYFKMYQNYYNFLFKKYTTTGDKTYNEKIQKLKETYNKNYEKLNIKAKYIKNQICENFDEMLKMK